MKNQINWSLAHCLASAVLLAVLMFVTPAAAQDGAAAPDSEISAEFPFEKRTIEVLGSRLAYVDQGEGPVVLFLHGNPTSSYLWRNIIPHVASNHRVIALDLIGMGDSDKPDLTYSFADHARYVDGFVAALDLNDITIVGHDWGSALGMRYARLNPENVVAIALMEPLMPPSVPISSFNAMDELTGVLFQAFHTPGLGEELILRHNFFVESLLGSFGAARRLSEQELAEYRRPFQSPASRRVTLVWPREMPIGDSKPEVAREIIANGEWFFASEIPKLFFHADPGALVPPEAAHFIISNSKNLTAVRLKDGRHYLQESHPQAIGQALAQWLQELEWNDQ